MPLPSIASDIPLDVAGQVGGPTPDAAPPLSFFDRVRLGYKQDQARPDWGFNETNWKLSALDEVETALRKKGIQPIVQLEDYGDWQRKLPIGRGERNYEDRVYRTFFQQVAQVRQSDPNFLPDYLPVVDKKSFDALVAERQRSQLDEVARQAPDGLGLGGLAGGIAHGALDPINYLPIGGEAAESASIGARILRNGLRWGAVNAGITAVTEPLVREHARALGIQRSGEDFLADLLSSGATGFVLGGPIAEGARFGAAQLKEALNRGEAPAAAATAEAAAPSAQAEAPAASDGAVARAFADLVPPEQRTPDEQAALHAVERDAEVKAASPFVASPAGDDEHAKWLDTGMKALSGEAQGRPAVGPIARETIASGADADGTRLPARELLKAKIHRAEAPGAADYNAASGATGPYQFTARTWVALFKRRYPNDPRGFDQIAALRRDPHLNDVLVNDLIAENAAALRHSGLQESAGNLYLAHFLGSDRAIRVLQAAGDTPIGKLLPGEYFHDNPFLKREWSAATLAQWAHGKMGDAGAAFASAPSVHGEEPHAPDYEAPVDVHSGRYDVDALFAFGGAESDRPMLKPELFDSPEQHAVAQVRFERSRDAAEGYAPVMSREEAFDPYQHRDALKAYRGTVTADAIGEALGLSPGEVRRVVGSMQALDPKSPYMLTRGRPEIRDRAGNVTQAATEAGRVIRRPAMPDAGPQSLLEFLARRGGLNDQGGDLRAMDAQLWHKGAPFRRKLIRDGGMALDDGFQAAIDAGYFPEHSAAAEHYADLPDVATFLDAIDTELRGRPRYAIHEQADAIDRQRQRFGEQPAPEAWAPPRAMTPEEIASHVDPADYDFMARVAAKRGFEADDDVLVEAVQRAYAGQDPADALDDAIMAAAVRDSEDFAALTGEIGYDHGDDWQAYSGDSAESRDGEPVDPGDEPSGGRSAAAAAGEGQGRAQLAQLADDPKAGAFADPVGTPAEAQADSLLHDLQMQERPAGDAGAAPEPTTYRLDEEGGESDLNGILDEIAAERKAADEMRNCLKPKGGEG